MSWTQIETTGFWFLYAAAFLAVASWETLRRKHLLSSATERRWSRHGVVMVAGTLALALVYRGSPVLVALKVSGSRFGLLNRPWLPYALRCALTIIVLDILRYTVHRAYHSFPLLWRVHQVHHSDPDMDVSTGARVHPLETMITQGSTLAMVAILAAPPLGVLLFELAVCAQSCFGHANASLPAWLERPLRAAIVTPDMHRIHHSAEASEQVRNLGDLFPWWDRLLGTYLADPAAGQERMTVGLEGYRNEASLGVAFMLLQPFQPNRDSEEAAT